MNNGKALIFSAPSGAGKTTIVRHLIDEFPVLDFSVSATTRTRRKEEVHGIDYYFLSLESFKSKIENQEFIEWEQVYEGLFYGTLKEEVQRVWDAGKHVIFDVDVEGGINLKNFLEDRALSVFVKVSDVSTLRERLERRKSETDDMLERRVQKAAEEMKFESKFDRVLVNDIKEEAFIAARKMTKDFLAS